MYRKRLQEGTKYLLGDAVRFFDIKLVSVCLLAIAVAGAMRWCGPDETLDARFFYSGVEAEHILYGGTSAQAERYFWNEILDLVFIALYSCMLWLCAVRFKITGWQKWVLAVLPGVFDILETMFILLALQWRASPEMLSVLAFVTASKWISAMLSVFFLIWYAQLYSWVSVFLKSKSV